MKHLFIMLALVAGVAFGQTRYNAKAFYGDILATNVSNMVLLGSLPGGAILTGVTVGEAVKNTNVAATNSIQIGIVSRTNYFALSTQLPLLIAPNPVSLALTNGFIIISQYNPTPIYGYITRVGAADSLIGTFRIVVEYLQK